jgi:uncharacterized flavoprotein (TIGR03862 family)
MTGRRPQVAIVGAGPAGLFAAERLAGAGASVTVFDRMASPARKFLLAGRGGLNITHSEPRAAFLSRYGVAGPLLEPALDAFPPTTLRTWAEGLGQDTFIGSSGRVFPRSFKASPLLRAWLARLDGLGVVFRMRRRLTQVDSGRLAFDGPDGGETVTPDAALLALGGASWPRMGSDGAWIELLAACGVPLAPLRPANMGVEIAWSAEFIARAAGMPLKRITATGPAGSVAGEAIITETGLEGGVIYALSAAIRDAIAAHGGADLSIDLKPDLTHQAIVKRLASARAKDSLSSMLRKHLGLPAQAVGLMREACGAALPREADRLAALVKAVPLHVQGTRPLERAISSAGGIPFSGVATDYQLTALPGIYVAGEMMDWEAPTGGYLLQATFATAEAAARGMARRLGLSLAPLAAADW